MRVLLVLVALLALAPTASHACSQRGISIFELFDRATTVAHVRVHAVPPRAGRVQLAVKRIVKGDRSAKLLATFETNTSCRVGFKRNATAIVFLDEAGNTVGHEQGYLTAVATWEGLVDAWAAASHVTRRGLLVEAIVADDGVIAHDAARYLADEPALLVKLDKDQRAQLALVQPKSKHSPLPQLRERLAGGALEAETDPARLAAIIAAGTGERDPDRIAALERCERAHGRRLYPYTAYRRGASEHFWGQLAAACKAGTPAR